MKPAIKILLIPSPESRPRDLFRFAWGQPEALYGEDDHCDHEHKGDLAGEDYDDAGEDDDVAREDDHCHHDEEDDVGLQAQLR